MDIRFSFVVASAAFSSLFPGSAGYALCIYNGRLYAKTTLEQEFADASFVVNGTPLTSRQISIPGSNEDIGIVYQIKVEQSFKGKAPEALTYYTRRNSGGFYWT